MRRCLFVSLFLLLFVACGNDAYDTGDGALSYMRADFVEASTDASARFVGVCTDDGEHLDIVPPVSCKWAEKPDTVYRALFYYNKKSKDGEVAYANPVRISPVLVPLIYDFHKLEGEPAVDPVTLVSAWRSNNGKYINLDLSVKTGKTEADESGHKMGLVYEGTEYKPGGGRLVKLLFTHNRNGIPEYYSVTAYVSIPLNKIPVAVSSGDDVVVSVNTYDGFYKKTFHF